MDALSVNLTAFPNVEFFRVEVRLQLLLDFEQPEAL